MYTLDRIMDTVNFQQHPLKLIQKTVYFKNRISNLLNNFFLENRYVEVKNKRLVVGRVLMMATKLILRPNP